MGRKPKTTGPTARGNPEAFKQVLTRMGVDGWRALRMLAVERDTTINALAIEAEPWQTTAACNLRTFGARRRDARKRAGRAPIIWFLDGGGDQSLTDRLFPSQLASATNGFGLFAGLFFRRLFVEACPLHLSEHAFALHLFL